MKQIKKKTKDEITIQIKIPKYVFTQLIETSYELNIPPEILAGFGLSNFFWKTSLGNLKGVYNS